MHIEDMDARWHQVAEDVMTGMKEWRIQHPKATFREVEAALDERLARLRLGSGKWGESGVSGVWDALARTGEGIARTDDSARPSAAVGTPVCHLPQV